MNNNNNNNKKANSDDNWPRLIQAGILDSLASAGFSTELEITREVAGAVCCLSLSEPHRVEIAYKCIEVVVVFDLFLMMIYIYTCC